MPLLSVTLLSLTVALCKTPSLLRNLLFGGIAIGLTAGCKLSKRTFCFCFLFSPENADLTQRKHTLGME